MSYEVNSRGGIRFARDRGASVRRELQSFGYEFPQYTYYYRKLWKANVILVWFYMPRSPQEIARIIDTSYERYYAMAEPDFDWQKVPVKPKLRLKFNYRYLIEMITQIAGGSYSRIHDIYLRNISFNRATQLVIALRHYKNEHDHWPVSLDDVKNLASPELFIDPINNDSFVYRLTEDGFTLYSKGKNNIDDGGERKLNLRKELRPPDDFLIWPPKNR